MFAGLAGIVSGFCWIVLMVLGYLLLGALYARYAYHRSTDGDKDEFIALDVLLWWFALGCRVFWWFITRPSKREKKATARQETIKNLNEELVDQQELAESLNDPILADMARQQVARIKKTIRELAS